MHYHAPAESCGGVCLFTPLLALFQLFTLRVSVYYVACTCCAHRVICDVIYAILILSETILQMSQVVGNN